jgi:hypothetical protein
MAKRVGLMFLSCARIVALVGLAWDAYALYRLLSETGGGRYPGAILVGRSTVRLETLSKGYVLDTTVYHTGADLLGVMRWYIRVLDVEPDEVGGAMSSCIALRKAQDFLLLRYGIVTTFCSNPEGALVFVNRSLAVYRKELSP